ncbi:MAG: hypothetical protein Q8K05_01395 [Polaromonas sp.]|uniref:hypothetical protein n=1 Tax=Polaromonas sp. TaxID=1869339 RepID=UPI00272FFEC9|nr:hypothetical protein [Polaromonas sp.]MDP2254707.1 hypothetical protein [Polaromonas sp.]MDP3708580.1 hypothetical protein [Polaromonas sp.]
MRFLIAASAVCLSACTLPSSIGPAAPLVNAGGQMYRIGQLTDSTWTATPTGMLRPLALSTSSRGMLLEAIEKTSGCKVTDSDYSRQGLQLDAQVDCGSKLNHQAPSTQQHPAHQRKQLSTP